MSLEQEVIALVAEQLGVDPTEVTPSKSFVEDLNADSLDLTELIMTLEEKFNIEIPEEKAEKLKTVRDVIEFVNSIKASK
jgi:acyl carrier protein